MPDDTRPGSRAQIHSDPALMNERRAAQQARGLHSPVGPRPGPGPGSRAQLHTDSGPAAPAREMNQYDEHRAILEHQMEKRQGSSWLQRSQEAQGRAQRQMSPRKSSRDRSRS